MRVAADYLDGAAGQFLVLLSFKITRNIKCEVVNLKSLFRNESNLGFSRTINSLWNPWSCQLVC